MEALLTQGNSEKYKSRFNAAFLAGSDYSLLPKHIEYVNGNFIHKAPE